MTNEFEVPESSYSPLFGKQVAAELRRQDRLGHTPVTDSEKNLDTLLSVAYGYLADGLTVKAGAMLIAARRWIKYNSHVNPMQREVARFMDICDQEVRKYPGIPDEEVKILRIRLMTEELLGSTRVVPASTIDLTENPHRLIFDKSDELVQSMLDDDIVGIADGLADVLYVVFGTAVAYGINIQEVFEEVHRSNMTKAVWSEELQRWIILKENNKVVKPETFSPAKLEPIVASQISRGKFDVSIRNGSEDEESI